MNGKRKIPTRILALLLSALMLMSLVPFSAFAANVVDSGQCGDNVYWTLYDNGEMVISGSGKMYNYDWDTTRWNSRKDQIKVLTVQSGVTSIGNYAFAYCHSLAKLNLSDSITVIGSDAFSDCPKITEISIPKNVTFVDEYAFADCKGLKYLKINGNVELLKINAFSGDDALEKITVDENNQYYSSDEYGVLFNKDKSVLYVYPRGNNRSHYSVPSSVKEIIWQAFMSAIYLDSILISKNVEGIGECALPNTLKTIYYTGTSDEWENRIRRNLVKENWGAELLASVNVVFNSEYPDEGDATLSQNSLQVYIDNPLFSYYAGESICLSIYQTKNGEKVLPENVTVTLSDNRVAKFEFLTSFDEVPDFSARRVTRGNFSKYNLSSEKITPPEDAQNYKLAVLTAVSAGNVVITVTSSDTGETFKIPVTVTSDAYRSWRADQLKSNIFISSESCYTSGNLHVTDFNYFKSGSDWKITMNVYNEGSSIGALEVYDSDGKLIRAEKIDQFRDENTGIINTFKNGWVMIDSAVKGEFWTVRNPTFSKCTPIEVTVPDGGYIYLTDDALASVSCYLYNIFDIALSSYNLIDGAISDAKFSEEQIDHIEKKLLLKFIGSEYYLNFAKKYMRRL